MTAAPQHQTTFTLAWRADNSGFARPGPARHRDLPFRFACKRCGATVSATDSKCSACGHSFWNAD